MFLFGFELDVLEIALREQQDMVDKIFLVESSQTHRGVSHSHRTRQRTRQMIMYSVTDTKAAHVGETEVQQEVQLCQHHQVGSCCG